MSDVQKKKDCTRRYVGLHTETGSLRPSKQVVLSGNDVRLIDVWLKENYSEYMELCARFERSMNAFRRAQRATRRGRNRQVRKPIFTAPSSWNLNAAGRPMELTSVQLACLNFQPQTWRTFSSIRIGRHEYRKESCDVNKKSWHRFVKCIFVSPDPDAPDEPGAEIHEDRYGFITDILQLEAIGETHTLLKVKWYAQRAHLVDSVTKNIYILKEVPMEESLILAEAVDSQVCIVPVPFTPRRLKRYNNAGRQKALRHLREDAPALRKAHSLLLVLDRRADYFGDVDS